MLTKWCIICVMNNAKLEISKMLRELEQNELSKRRRTSLYLSSDLYEEFRIVCGNISPSRVIEELMRAAVEESKQSA